MTVIPCAANERLRRLIHEYAEVLKTQAHTLGAHGLSEREFYNSGVFRGAVERVRGEIVASMGPKRAFVQSILDYLQRLDLIADWQAAGSSNRYDYSVTMPSGRVAAIELKGCLDGNNTNIFERPPHASEFILWSVCTNAGADPKHNAWSGIHTRLSAEIIARGQRVDGLLIWDMVCGTIGRKCPKLDAAGSNVTEVGPYRLPPPCVYVFPATIASPRNNPRPQAQALSDVSFLHALHTAFRGDPEDVNRVSFAVEHKGAETLRTTTIVRRGEIVEQSRATPIRRA